MNWLHIILFIALWTLAAVIYFFLNLGKKNKPDPWWAWLLAPPMLFVAFTVGTIDVIFGKRK